MGYRNPDHSLHSPLSDIIKGIEDFDNVANYRIMSTEYNKEHIKELNEMRIKLYALKIELELMKKDNW